MNNKFLNETCIDVFKEISNIGSSHATSALAKMLGDVLKMKVPNVSIIKVNELSKLLGNEEQVVAATLLTMDGDVKGIMMNIFNEESTKKLIDMVIHRKLNTLGDITEIETSFLKELGNILTSAYLSALGTLTNLKIIPSVPNLCVDMAGAILSVPAIQYGIMSDDMMLIQTQFESSTEVLTGYYLLVPDEPSFIKILSSLGVSISE
ncbi:MAG: chemotaxis protein CheC [Clostridia bacterium]|nr:chemotaxis protein CheC [Clostridia bacterium]